MAVEIDKRSQKLLKGSVKFMMSSVIIAVVVVLGIIVAGGFLLYFMGDLLMSISGKKKDSDAVKEKQRKEQKELEDRVNALENSEEARNDPAIATVLYNGNEEEEKEEEPVEEETTEQPEEEPEEEAEEPEQEETDDVDDTSEYIRQRRKELLERLARMQEENDETADEEADVVDLSEQPQVEEVVEEPAEETPVEETEETTEEEEPEEEPAEEQVEETAEQEVPVEETPVEENPTVQRAADISFDQAKADGVDALVANFSLEELERRLVEEQERLKQNEKDLRKNKKEFIPLRRVKNNLESDEKKLRRKEAMVAKQKVVLYGVNNYADIDEEKAQKLAEDLDLLDGLKLSVQHCHEVMEANKERYPLLEQIYNLLSSQNTQIKQDIKTLQEAIERLKAENPDAE